MRAAFFTAVCGLAGLAAAGTWQIVDKDIATIDIGVAFLNSTCGYAGVTNNGVGPQILKTLDGGVKWQPCEATFGLDLLLMDIDAADNSIVVSSVFGELYSDNAGKTFAPSTGGGTSQNVRYLGRTGDGGLKYGCAGQYGNVQGVAVSVDGGKTFTVSNANISTWARYAAFPTDTTWYVAGGVWGGSGDDDSTPLPATGRRHRFFDRTSYFYTQAEAYKKAQKEGRRLAPAASASPSPCPNGYAAQVAKTTDGGKTWNTVFNSTNQFYFNGIDCSPTNPDVCCVVGDGDPGQCVTNPGAWVVCTFDGGKNWSNQYFVQGNATMDYSFMELRFSSGTEAWAIGGVANAGDYTMQGWFLHTTDGGKTWGHGVPPMSGYMGVSLSFPDADHGFASMLDVFTQATAVAAYTA